MLKNSRVLSTPDTSRIASAVRVPGIDPRTWVSLAIVKKIKVDPQEGVFVDVRLMPSKQLGTCRLAQEYAGDGFGLYTPVEVDDEVLVEAPSGDPDHGLILTRRLHSASHPPPADVDQHPEDVLLIVKKDKSLRIIASGGGTVVIEARDNSLVKLGGDDASAGAARVGDAVVTSGTLGIADLQTLLDTRYQLRASPPPAALAAGTTIGSISTGSDKVRVK